MTPRYRLRLQSLSGRVVGYVEIPGVGTLNAARACAQAWVAALEGSTEWSIQLQDSTGETLWSWRT